MLSLRWGLYLRPYWASLTLGVVLDLLILLIIANIFFRASKFSKYSKVKFKYGSFSSTATNLLIFSSLNLWKNKCSPTWTNLSATDLQKHKLLSIVIWSWQQRGYYCFTNMLYDFSIFSVTKLIQIFLMLKSMFTFPKCCFKEISVTLKFIGVWTRCYLVISELSL